MLEELSGRRQRLVNRLASHERPPGYISLKIDKVLPQLGRAIQKAQEGTYGICDDCDDDIPEERLKAAPGATRCVVCQHLWEKSL